ncbi:MAG: sulfite exporter TauE/SafE family protein [Dehalococcoidia bacterium]
MLTGVSGAALLTPFFLIVFPLLGLPKLTPAEAIATALFLEIFGFTSGTVGYVRRRMIDYKTALPLVAVAIPFGVLGSIFSQNIDGTLLKGIYGGCMFPLAAYLYITSRQMNLHSPGVGAMAAQPEEASDLAAPGEDKRVIISNDGLVYRYRVMKSRLGALITAVGATSTGLISSGLGEVQLSQLSRRFRLPLPIAAATSVFIVTITVYGATGAHIFQLIERGGVNAVPWDVIAWALPGAIIGGQVGARLQGHLPTRFLEYLILAIFLTVGVVLVLNATALQSLLD